MLSGSMRSAHAALRPVLPRDAAPHPGWHHGRLPVAPIALGAAALLTSVGLLAAAPAGARPGREARLSDELTITRWAHPRERAQVRTHPWRTSRAFTRLRAF